MKTKLVHVWLEPDRIMFLCVQAKRLGVSIDELENVRNRKRCAICVR
jgi:hypothetical protein